MVIEKNLGNALVQLHMIVENNIIKQIRIYTDSLDINLCEMIQNKLVNTEYSKFENVLHSIEEEIR